MSKFFDFDAFWSEAMSEEAERPQIKVFGEVIDLPAVLPARIMLKALRNIEADDRSLGEQIVEYVSDLELFVGKERVERWLDQGIEVSKLVDIFTRIIQMYTSDLGESAEAEGNAPAPAQGETKRARS